MRWISTALALSALLAFASFVQAKPHGNGAAAGKSPKPHTGTIVSVEKDKLTVSFSSKNGKTRDRHVKVDGATKVTLDGKQVALSDLKAGEQVTITSQHGKATEVEATSAAPKP